MIAMALEVTLDNASAEFLLLGRPPVPIIVQDTLGVETNKGDKLILGNNDPVLEVDQAEVGRIVGYVEITAATVAIATAVPVFFNGVDWLGAT